MAGALTDNYGSKFAFFGLTGVALVALLVAAVFMPETREPDGMDPKRQDGALASIAV